MNRTEFRAFCEKRNLVVADAGRDWKDASVDGAYVCAVVSSAEDFAAIKPLLDDGSAFLASSPRKAGQAWFEYAGHGRIDADDAASAARRMAEQYAEFLAAKEGKSGDIGRYDKREIDKRHAPAYVDKPGFWNNDREELLLSDAEIADGIMCYRYDDFEQSIVCILSED